MTERKKIYFIKFLVACFFLTVPVVSRIPTDLNDVIDSEAIRITDDNIGELERLKDKSIIGSLYLEDVNLENFTFTNLYQIIDYLVLNEVKIKSLKSLFPNLLAVRGFTTYKGFSAVLNEVSSLEFNGTVFISRLKHDPFFVLIFSGGVYLKNNKLFCLINDFDTIIQENEVEKILVDNNLEYCPPFLKEENSDIKCQKDYSGNKCSLENAHICRHLVQNKLCVDTCAEDYLKYKGYRCIHREECRKLDGSLYANNTICTEKCPEGFVIKRFEDGRPNVCGRRTDEDVCESATVSSCDLGSSLKGCTVIKNLDIKGIGEDCCYKNRNDSLYETLKKNLGNIRRITGQLRVMNCDVLQSLGFLNQVTHIGENLRRNETGLVIVNNNKLKNLNLKGLKKIYGKVLILGNRKLCSKEIENFSRSINISDRIDVNDNANARAECYEFKTELFVQEVKKPPINHHQSTVILYFRLKYEGKDDRNIPAFIIYYKETPENVSILEGDTCESHTWSKKEMFVEGIVDDCSNFNFTIENLKPKTRYGFFLRSVSLSDTPYTIVSDITYVETLNPSTPKVDKNRLLVDITKTNDARKLFYKFEIKLKEDTTSSGSSLEYTIDRKNVPLSANPQNSTATVVPYVEKLEPLESSKCPSETEHDYYVRKKIEKNLQNEIFEIIAIERIKDATIGKRVKRDDPALYDHYGAYYSESELLSKSYSIGGNIYILDSNITDIRILNQSTISIPLPKRKNILENIEVQMSITSSISFLHCETCIPFFYESFFIPLEYLGNFSDSFTVETHNEETTGETKALVTFNVDPELEKYFANYKLEIKNENSKEIYKYEFSCNTTKKEYRQNIYIQESGQYEVHLEAITLSGRKIEPEKRSFFIEPDICVICLILVLSVYVISGALLITCIYCMYKIYTIRVLISENVFYGVNVRLGIM